MVSAGGRSQPNETSGAAAAPTKSSPEQERGAREQQGSVDGSATATAGRNGSASAQQNGAGRSTPLLPPEQAESYRSRWEDIQTGFVDEPRQAVEQADHLVAEVIKRVAEVFADERGKLEGQWSRGDQVDTEQLRVGLTRYRSFFERLLVA
jgi:hypothetical protein